MAPIAMPTDAPTIAHRCARGRSLHLTRIIDSPSCSLWAASLGASIKRAWFPIWFGIYPENLDVPKVPAALTKLAIYVRISVIHM